MGTGIRRAGIGRFASGTRKRAVMVAMTGAVVAAAVALASPAGAAPIPSRTATTGLERIQIMTTSGTSATLSVIADGLFTAGGVVDQGVGMGTVVLPGGTFVLKHSKPVGPQTQNAKTCLYTDNGHGTFTLIDGTGAYKGISGHGKFTVSVLDIQPRSKSGACDESAAPAAYEQVIDAVGPATRP